MKRALVGILTLALVGTGLALWLSLRSRPVGAAAQQTIVLNPGQQDTEQFAPPSPGQQPAMTSDQAIAAFQGQNPGFTLPSDATAQLGNYTAATGDGSTYRYQNRLAWGFSWHQCEDALIQNPAPIPPGTDLPCTRWLFLDANTGQMLESLWQQTAASPSG